MNVGIPRPIKERKKHDRFNGMPEEEVSKRTLPDHLTENLDIIIVRKHLSANCTPKTRIASTFQIGINPGLFAAYKGHHYAGPGNHFWKCLYLSGLTPQQMSADEDYKLLQVYHTCFHCILIKKWNLFLKVFILFYAPVCFFCYNLTENVSLEMFHILGGNRVYKYGSTCYKGKCGFNS